MKIYILTAFVLMLTMVNCAVAQKSLLTNGGFEDELYGWNNNGARLTPWDFKSGKNSCAIVTPNTEKWVGIDQTVRIPKKAKVIEFSAWIKAMNVVKGKDEWNGAIFTVVFLDNQDKEITPGLNIVKITGDQEWKLEKARVKLNGNENSFKILVAMGNASGTMIVDDIAAVVVNE